MSAATQQYRQCELISPLGKDVLLFHRMIGYERLGRLFEYQVEVVSTDHGVNFTDILGQSVAIRLSLPLSDSERFFHGHVSDFAQVDSRSLRYSKTKAGKVILGGAYVLSRSSGVNRIKGGSVQIN